MSTTRRRPRPPLLPIAALAAVLALAACVGPDDGPSAAPSSAAAARTPGPSPDPGVTTPPSPSPTPAPASATAAPAGRTPPDLTLAPAVGGLDAPLDIAVRPSEPGALYVVEQIGRIRVVRDGVLAEEAALDIAGMVTAGGEQGLLGLAFHPDPADDRLFVYYTALDGDQVVASFRMPAGGDAVDPASQTVILRMADRFGNHNGGSLAFGPDGYLYIGTGDGGGGGDPLDSGRRLDTLLAKVLRIDVDVPGGADRPYRVPDDNPFVSVADARPEIWATGLRNPWRMRFDRATGDLWIGDVGQGSWEEVDRAPAGVGGLDFGWNHMEGFDCYQRRDCASPDFTLPVTAYDHGQGCSVTGGTVYRGSVHPRLVGWYVFSDYCSGTLWAIDADAADPSARQEPIVVGQTDRSISAVAEDAAGELLVTDLRSGEVLRIAPAAT